MQLHKSTYPAVATTSKSTVFFHNSYIHHISMVKNSRGSDSQCFFSFLWYFKEQVSCSSRILVVCLNVVKKWPLLFLGWRDNSPQHKNNSLVKVSLLNFTMASSWICVLLFKDQIAFGSWPRVTDYRQITAWLLTFTENRYKQIKYNPVL